MIISMARSMTAFVRNRLRLLSCWQAMKNVFTRQAAICERCTSMRDSRCCTCPFLILGFQPKTTWNRLSNTPLPTHRLYSLVNTLGGRPQPCYFSSHLRRTWRADTMARIARHSALFALPADAPLTPRTFNPVITLPPDCALLSKRSVCRLELVRHFT